MTDRGCIKTAKRANWSLSIEWRSREGFSLIELIITIAILGMIAYSMSVLHSGMLAAASGDDVLTAAVKLAEARMEESIAVGAGVATEAWTTVDPFEWKRDVGVLRDEEGSPTLVALRITVRRGQTVICSLITHIAA